MTKAKKPNGKEADSWFSHETKSIDIDKLTPHHRNYKVHPEDQIKHLAESIREHGFYRNIVVSREGTILAGHGVVEAALSIGIERVPVIQLNLSPDEPRALKLLAGDNEVQHLGEVDDRALSELLREIRDTDVSGLLGTGYDDQMLAALVMVSRAEGEIENFDAAKEWVGMPDFEVDDTYYKVVVTCDNEEGMQKVAELLNVTVRKKGKKTWSVCWPDREKEDIASLRFETE